MSTPKERRRGPATPLGHPDRANLVLVPPMTVWEPIPGFPGYILSEDGRLAREIKVRTNKNGTRWARVMRKGKQTVIRL